MYWVIYLFELILNTKMANNFSHRDLNMIYWLDHEYIIDATSIFEKRENGLWLSINDVRSEVYSANSQSIMTHFGSDMFPIYSRVWYSNLSTHIKLSQ